ncbi:MAG: flippase [Candidatus Diapherotrites archaeon]|nr:flippase [Candidatus Diapherotrites archaeon]
MNTDLSLLVKGAALMTIGVFASKILGYAFQIFLARILTPSELGLFLIATSVVGLFAILSNFGIAESLSRFIAFYYAKKEYEKTKGSIISAFTMHSGTAIGMALILFFGSDLLAVFVFSKPELGIIFKILAFTLPLSIFSVDCLMAMEGFKKIKYKILTRRFLQLVAKFGVLIFFWLLGLSLMAAVLAYLVSEIVALFFSAFFLKKKVFPKELEKVKAVLVKREMASFAWPLLLAGVFANILITIDVIMLGYFAPAYDAGQYGIAHTTGQLGLMPLEIMLALAVPIATGYIALNKIAELKKIYAIISRWIFSLAFPLGLLLVLFAVPIQIFLFGNSYAESAGAMVILVAGYFAFCLFGPAQQTLLAAGKTKLNFINSTTAGIVTVILNALLIPYFLAQNSATIGAAISTAVAYSLWGLMGFAELFWLYKIKPFTSKHIKVFAAAIASVAIGFFTANFFLDYSIFSAIATGIIFLAIYPVFLLSLHSFEKEDIEIMFAIERKTGLRIEFVRNIVKKFL